MKQIKGGKGEDRESQIEMQKYIQIFLVKRNTKSSVVWKHSYRRYPVVTTDNLDKHICVHTDYRSTSKAWYQHHHCQYRRHHSWIFIHSSSWVHPESHGVITTTTLHPRYKCWYYDYVYFRSTSSSSKNAVATVVYCIRQKFILQHGQLPVSRYFSKFASRKWFF